MVGILVVSHGRLATELLAAARTIEPALAEQARAITLEWNVDPETARAEIARTLKELDTGDGVVVLTDMFGGTPSNLSLTFLETDKVEIVTGVNLPMLIKLAGLRQSTDLLAVARQLRDTGRSAIHVPSDLLRGEAKS